MSSLKEGSLPISEIPFFFSSGFWNAKYIELPKVGNKKYISFFFAYLRNSNFYGIVATFGGSEQVVHKAGGSASVK